MYFVSSSGCPASVSHVMGALLGVVFMRETNPPMSTNHPGLPLPAVLHRELTEGEIGGRQVMVIGDVHGCLDELQARFNSIQYNTIQYSFILAVSRQVIQL